MCRSRGKRANTISGRNKGASKNPQPQKEGFTRPGEFSKKIKLKNPTDNPVENICSNRVSSKRKSKKPDQIRGNGLGIRYISREEKRLQLAKSHESLYKKISN